MNEFIRAVGISSIKQQSEVEKLVKHIILTGEINEEYKKKDGTTVVEYTKQYSPHTSIKVVGERDQEDNFHFKYIFPVCKADETNEEEEIYINKRVDTDACTGMCDDYRFGVSLIFYIQNLIDYHKHFDGIKIIENGTIKLSALSTSGKVLLPTLPRITDSPKMKKEIKNKNTLIAEAKKGNQEAIESLTMDEIDKYAIVSQRIKKEDIFSIVDTSFVPYGSESDIYNIIGNIVSAERENNNETGESLWHMVVECNSLCFDLCINSEDLMGEPEAGRRFRGSIWMQGYIAGNDNINMM